MKKTLLSIPEQKILNYLSREDNLFYFVTFRKISLETNIDKGNLSRYINNLENKGFVYSININKKKSVKFKNHPYFPLANLQNLIEKCRIFVRCDALPIALRNTEPVNVIVETTEMISKDEILKRIRGAIR